MSSILEYKGYHASIEYDAEDNIFVGEVIGITDSLNFHGTSVDEVKEMFKQSIDNYLILCKNRNVCKIINKIGAGYIDMINQYPTPFLIRVH